MGAEREQQVSRELDALAAGWLVGLSFRVHDEGFSDAVLVVLGHGTEQNAASAAPVYQHAAELRRRKIFGGVREAFWKQEPQIKQVLSEISAPRVFIAPLFISEGYFAGQVIPRELGLAENAKHGPPGASILYCLYCQPVGTHDSMRGIILSRAREVVARFPFPRAPEARDTTLFIAGHGTEKDANSRQVVERQAELIRAANFYAAVHAIFLEEAPYIADCYGLAQTRNLVVVPFFISDGLHTQEDIPVRLGESERVVRQRLDAGQPPWRNPTERNGCRVWYAPAVGTEPHLADVILERVREAARMEDRGEATG